jgi:ATP-dependent 26S proteasome regulatory subunit
VDLDALVAKTVDYSAAEIAEICRLGGLIALREVDFKRANPIHHEHLLAALQESEEKRGGSTRFVKSILGFTA